MAFVASACANPTASSLMCVWGCQRGWSGEAKGKEGGYERAVGVEDGLCGVEFDGFVVCLESFLIAVRGCAERAREEEGRTGQSFWAMAALPLFLYSIASEDMVEM